jgi:hypothetical protein
MNTQRAAIALMAVGLLSVGCRGTADDTLPTNLPGSYVYAGKGSTLKKPWEFSARIDLTPDKHYVLTLDKTIEGHTDSTETNFGTYSVSGDQVVLREDERGTANSQDVHKLKIRADSLIAEVGWTAQLFIKAVGAPNIVFVKERRG